MFFVTMHAMNGTL
jgi:hypothetical protein